MGRPKSIGHQNPAVLCRHAECALSIDAKYDPPGSAWLAIIATFGITVIAVFLFGFSGTVIGAAGGGGIAATYNLIRSWRKREIRLDLGTTTDVVVDEKRRRIAFLQPLNGRARWVVLEFKDGFPEACNAVRDILGVKCRAGKISGVDMVFVAVLLSIILLFVAAFGYFIVKATMVGGPPR